MTGPADRFDGAPQEHDPDHPDLGWTIAEPIPFDPWPDGKPAPPWRVLGIVVGRPLLAWQGWKRRHDRCYRALCFRRRYRAPGAKGSWSVCPRHKR